MAEGVQKASVVIQRTVPFKKALDADIFKVALSC